MIARSIVILMSWNLLWGVHAAECKEDSIVARFFPSRLLFRPLQAAIFEPRVGFQLMTINRVRLDIGYSGDIVSGELAPEARSEGVQHGTAWSCGVDAFTYTRLRSETNLKFPVETVDYMFGFNGAVRRSLSDNRIIAGRVRLSHISAHLADGLADTTGVLAQRPFIYSREFVDAIITHEWRSPSVRLYAGGTFLLNVKQLPKPVGRFIPQIGAEWYSVAGFPIVVAYNLQVVQVEQHTVPNHAIQLLVRPFEQIAPTVALCGYYYSGYSIHGMFYDRREQYWAVGMQVLL